MKQHKWHKEIKAWADGAEIEYALANSLAYKWYPLDEVSRFEHRNTNFRIKPQTVKFSSSGHHFRFKEKNYLYVINNWGSLRLSEGRTLQSNEFLVGKIEVQNETT